MIKSIQEASEIYEGSCEDKVSILGQALCAFQKAVLLEKQADRDQSNMRSNKKEAVAVKFENTAELFEQANHPQGQLLALEHALKNQNFDKMEEEKLNEMFTKLNTLREQIKEAG